MAKPGLKKIQEKQYIASGKIIKKLTRQIFDSFSLNK